jgi:hypothetical protein
MPFRPGLLLAAILALLPRGALAQCQSAPACAVAPCPFSSATSWLGGAGCPAPPDHAGEDWVIRPGHTVIVDAADQVTGLGTVEGNLSFDPAPANRDAHGYRNLTIVAAPGDDLICSSAGSMRLRAGDRLRFDTRQGVAGLAHYNGCGLDFQGAAIPTTLVAAAAADDGPACGHTTPVGRAWTITPAAGLEQAKVGRRIIFQSGALRTRQFEIAAVTPTAIVLCSHLADALSLGERLTPRAPAGTPPGPGTAAHHSTPAVTAGNDACTGPGAPHPCCRDVGAGTCVDGPDPAPGDAILIVDDGTIDQAAGNGGWRLVDRGDGTTGCNGLPCSGSDPFPLIQYMNLSGFGGGGNSQGVTAAALSVRSAEQFVPDFVGNNLHGFRSDYGIVFRGIKHTRIEWNAVHDSDQPPGTGDNFCQLNVHQHKRIEEGLLDTPAADVLVRNNVAWGTKQCAIQVNDAENGAESPPLFQASGIEVSDNLVFGGCAVGPGIACEAIHIHSCRDCRVRRNVCYDMHNADQTAGTCIKVGGTADDDGTDVSFNWLVNGSGYGIRCDDDPSAPANVTNCLRVGITGNYVSHFGVAGGRGGRWFGNVVKNFGLLVPSGGAGVLNPIRAHGLYVGLDDAVAATPVCTASPNRCGRTGLAWYRGLGNNARADVVASELVLGKLSENPGATERAGMDNDGFGTELPADFNGTISHVTHDHHATWSGGRARTFDFASGAPAVPVLWQVRDLLAGYKGDDAMALCSTAANLTESLGAAFSLLTGTISEGGGTYSAGCSSTGTLTRTPAIAWKDRLHRDYGLAPGSPESTAAADGSAIGARAFLFRPERIGQDWGGALPFDDDLPASFSNGTPNTDADDDAVMDFIDDCPAASNPSQVDRDDDRFGDACDCAPADAAVWGLPGDANGPTLTHTPPGPGGVTTLAWTAPATGGLPAAMTYDVVRSPAAADFVAAGACLESDGGDLQATDPSAPAPGGIFFYVVRAQDACGAGVSHRDGAGTPRPARDCP